jgi:DNA-binding NarL/FixJ family response regulator
MASASAVPEPKRRVLVADDHRLILAAVRWALDQANGFEVVAEVSSGSMVVPYVARLQPDLVLLDVGLPGVDGLTCLERLRTQQPEVPVVMFSAWSDQPTLDAARAAGARGFIVKTLGALELEKALHEVLAATDFRVVGDDAAGDESSNPAGLSDRELAMLRNLARGLSNKAIGRELWITEQTVKFHLTNIYRKLGVENRTQAVRFAYEEGLVRAEAGAA